MMVNNVILEGSAEYLE